MRVWIENVNNQKLHYVRKTDGSIRGSYSSWVRVISGVPSLYVCWVGPVLYTYVDHTKVERQISLQCDLDNLVVWSRKWQLRFNLDKCKMLPMGRGNSKLQCSMGDQLRWAYLHFLV